MFSNDKVHLDGPVARYFRKTSLPVRAGFHHFSVKHKARTPIILSFFVGRWVNCPMFSLWTNRWSVWSTHFFSLHIFNLSLFYFFFFFLSFSPDTQALQCMLISLQAELDIQRYLMKIESSQRVSTLPFLFSASSRTHLLPFYSAMCGILIGVSRQTEHLYFSPVCPETWFKPLKAKCLQWTETCAFKKKKNVRVIIKMSTNCMLALK